MKKISLFIQIAALTAGLPAFALTGGPFDNGSYGILDERNGFYESAFSFSNGSGYSVWTADNLQGALSTGGTVTPNIGAGSLINSSGSTNNANRTVIYYKGVTYFGSAMGQVDTTARTIQGFANATSDFSTAQTTQTANTSFFASNTSTAFSTNTVVSSGRSYTANLNWTGKITATSPQLRFSGTGELAIIAPNGAEAIAGLAYSGFSQLITGIASSVSNLFSANVSLAGSVDPYGDAAAAISLSLTSLTPYLSNTGPSSSYAGSETETIKVTGYRRYY